MRNECYFCGCKLGKYSKSREHIPPKQIFKDFEYIPFTVPSCHEHNIGKCGEDEAIIKGFLISLSLQQGNFDFNDDVKKAIKIAFPNFNQVKKNVIEINLLNDHEEINTSVSYLSENINLGDWIIKLSAGILYTALKEYDQEIPYKNARVFNSTFSRAGIDGLNSEEYLSSFYEKEEIISKLRNLKWVPGWKSGKNNYPETLYSFFYNCSNIGLIIKHRFYQEFTFYCHYDLKKEKIQEIYDKISRCN